MRRFASVRSRTFCVRSTPRPASHGLPKIRFAPFFESGGWKQRPKADLLKAFIAARRSCNVWVRRTDTHACGSNPVISGSHQDVSVQAVRCEHGYNDL